MGRCPALLLTPPRPYFRFRDLGFGSTLPQSTAGMAGAAFIRLHSAVER